jgi:adenylate cyclase
MSYRLVSGDGQLSFELRAGSPLVLGRALSSDLPVLDPTVSRRHAELSVQANEVALRDLGSSNGTFVNGARVSDARLVAGDRIVFGKILFELRQLSPVLIDDDSAETMRRAARAGTTIIRQVPVPDADQTLERALRASGVQAAIDDTAVAVPQHERDRLRLTLLLEISKAFTRVVSVDALLDKLLDFTFRLLDVDQGAVLLVDEGVEFSGVTRELSSTDLGEGLRVARTRVRPGVSPHPVPMGLARTAVEERMALLSDNVEDAERSHAAHRAARADGGTTAVPDGSERTLEAGRATPPSIKHADTARAVICAPLLGGEGHALGCLLVESSSVGGASPAPALGAVSATSRGSDEHVHRMDDDDLEFLVALAGIGAVALENLKFAERSRQEALIRGNFERFFAPHLAARIASAPGALRRGGERRRVAVLFSDIRGFTALAARLTPDATASLLSEYFSEMAECVFTHGGTLDKFIGDAVMAQWGAPLSAPGGDDADRALEAGQAMLAAVARLNQRWAAQGRPGLEVGLGINYGEVFAGYLGSERRLEYTIIGDVVNTASRLCEAAQGGELLVTPQLKQALTRPHRLTPHAALWLPGRDRTIPVFNAAL